MFKPVCNIPIFFTCLCFCAFSCELGNKQADDHSSNLETEKLQREVDSLRRVKEELQDQLHTINEDEAPGGEPAIKKPEAPSNTFDGQGSDLKVVSAKKQFDANFNPVLSIVFRNTAEKTITSTKIGVDFSYNSTEITDNCHFDQKLPLKLAPNTNRTLVIPIPSGYDKTCADKAWVVIKEVIFADGTKE